MRSLKYLKKRTASRFAIARARHASRSIISTNTAHQPVFIVSSGRAGTTILRKCLMTGGEIHIPPESGECIPRALELYTSKLGQPWLERVEAVIGEFTGFADFSYWDIDLDEDLDSLLDIPPDKQTFCAIIDHIYRSHARKKNPSASRWGDKTPILCLSLDRLHACYPQGYYIHMVRDPRDVVASAMNAFDVDFLDALDRWRLSYKCADKWNRSGKLKMIALKYEDLVANPEHSLQSTCAFINLDYTPSMLGKHLEMDYGDTSLPHLRGTDEALRPGGMPLSRRNLSTDQLKIIENKTARELELLGYS